MAEQAYSVNIGKRVLVMSDPIGELVEAKAVEITRRLQHEDETAWAEGYEQGYEDATEPYPTHGWER